MSPTDRSGASKPEDPARRLEAANEALEHEIETGAVLGIAGIEIPQHANALAMVNALSLLLIEKGVMTEAEFVAKKTDQMAELVEGVVVQLKQIKAQLTSKVLLPPNGSQN